MKSKATYNKPKLKTYGNVEIITKGTDTGHGEHGDHSPDISGG